MAKAENVPGTDEKSEKKSAPSLSHNITGRRLILSRILDVHIFMQVFVYCWFQFFFKTAEFSYFGCKF